MELNELRNQIDEIDRELVSLFIRRMSCSSEIAEYKRRNALPVLDREREIKLLEKIAELSGKEFEEYTAELYKTILSLSRDYQQKLLDEEDGEKQ